MEVTHIKHFTHKHVLTWQNLDVSERSYHCNMCNRKIHKDFYDCGDCWGWIIHRECMKSPEHINHSLHPLHPLTLAKRSLNNNDHCFYCENPFEQDEFVYSCDPLCAKFYMHMTCALIPLPTITSNVDADEDHSAVQYACHQQPMTLVEHPDRNKREAQCFACQSSWSTPAFSCTSEMCTNFLHKSCTEIPQKIRHPFHSSHFLLLQVSKPQSCRSCCKKNCRLIYSCQEDGCNFILCIECLSSKTIVRSQSHDHSLSLVEKSCCESQCDVCKKSYYNNRIEVFEINRTRSIMFRCMECVFNLHFLCGPLPSTINYEGHIHALIISDHSAIEDGSDEYYCDVCEEICDLASRVYYCEKCKYGAHIHCLIQKIMKIINGDLKHVELQTLGENRWVQLGIESKECHEEKEFTLKDIMDGLTQAEKETLINPIHYSNVEKTRRRYAYEYWRSEVNFCLDPKQISQRIFGPHSSYISDFVRAEIFHFTPEEGLLRVDDKYLMEKVREVDGYMVPKTLALILRTMLRKYGDLGGDESLTPTLRSVTATLLCIVVDKLCNTKVEDITRDDLNYFNLYLTGIKEITNFKTIDMYLRSLDGLLYAFLGFKAIRCENDIEEQIEMLHQKIEMLQDELKTCMKNREKLKIDSPTTPGPTKNWATQASKWKGKKWGDNWF